MSPRLRTAGRDDAERIVLLHADSWRRNYRGVYADSFLDGDVVTDRLSVWTSRLAAPADSLTFVAEDEAALLGFVHVIFDKDVRWGSLIDNLHVAHGLRRTGVGSLLLTRAAEAVAEHAAGKSIYLWVQEQNAAAQQFYRAMGGISSEKGPISPPGGVSSRLSGTHYMFRFTWSDTSSVTRTNDH